MKVPVAQEQENSGIYVSTLNQDGTAPKARISTPEQARRIYERSYTGYVYGRGRVNAKVQAAINGEQPVPQSKLNEEGLGWMSNVNFRMLEADVNTAQIPYYMLFADVPQYVQVKVRIPSMTEKQNKVIGDILGEEHKILCNQWKQFDYTMQLSIANMVKYGAGPLYYPDDETFVFKAAPQGTVYVPDETTMDMTEMSLMFIYYEWEITALYNEIMAPGASNWWDIQAIKDVLVDACNQFVGFSRNRSWEYWEQKLREQDVYWSNAVPKIRTAWGYVREFDGKISRFLITASYTAAADKWLYYGDREFDNWGQIVHPMFVEIGNGNWNGVKGIGIKAYNWRDSQNRLWNRIMDAAFIGSQIMFTAKDAKAAEDFQMTQLGPAAVINADYQPIQSPMLSTLDKPMQVAEAMERGLQRNIGGMRQGALDSQTMQPITAAQANIDAQNNTQLSQSNTTLYLRQLDDLYEEQFRRLGMKVRNASEKYPYTDSEKIKKEFRDRVKARGVPDSAFDHILSVTATRTVGRGSEYIKQQVGSQVYSILRGDPSVPQGVVVEHLRNLVSNLTGQEYLQMIWPEELLTQDPTNDMSKAQDENGVMTLGIPAIWTPEQDNLAHATTHLQFLIPAAQAALQGQGDPQKYLKLAQVGVPHVQQHIEALRSRGSKGQPYQQLHNALEQLIAQTTQIQQQFQEHMQAQAAQQQKQQAMLQQAQQTGQMLDPESQVKMARVQADAKIKAVSTAAEIKRKGLLAAADIVSKHLKTGQQLAINDLQTAQDLSNNAIQNNPAPSPEATPGSQLDTTSNTP